MRYVVLGMCFIVAACGGSPSPAALAPRDAVMLQVKDYIGSELQTLIDTVGKLQNRAPQADASGWQSPRDDAAIAAMQTHWRAARMAYEHIEGAIAVLFSHLDLAVDGRYENFVQGRGDVDLFKGVGFTGMHAVERILWSRSIPNDVREHERSTLLHHGYQAARWPEDARESADFRTCLVAQLLRDLRTMQDEFAPQALDLPASFNGVIGSIKEQREKLNYANTGEDESRYAQHTLADMRANLAGGRQIYSMFQPLLLAQQNGDALDEEISAHFEQLALSYAHHSGDNVPAVPPSWKTPQPSPEDLATPFGRLWSQVFFESNEAEANSLVSLMNQASDAMGLFE